jgi:hypothetical protein
MAILEGLKKVNPEVELPEFEMVYWSDLLYEKPLDINITDKKDPYYLDEKYLPSSVKIKREEHPYRLKFIQYASRKMNDFFLKKDFTPNHSYIADVIVNRYFRDLAIYYNNELFGEAEKASSVSIKEMVRARLMTSLQKHKDKEIFLIAHSMGSIIAYDVLSFVLPHVHIHTLATIGSPLGLPVVISKIVSEQKDRINGSAVLKTPSGVTQDWYNFSDVMDNVAFNYKLSDDFSENSLGIKPIDYIITNDYVCNGERNPHKSYGYLRAREFARVLNDFITLTKVKPAAQFKERITNLIERIKPRKKNSKS